MKIAHISTGAAGMLCGTCIHNNTLAKALIRQGHDATLVPTYTPLRTDEDSIALDRVFYGAINVYLKQSSPVFRHMPKVVDWMLDRPKLLNFVSRFANSTNAETLGAMTLAVLEGEDGTVAKELEKLVAWLKDELQPDIVHLSLSLFLGFARRIKEELGVPVVCELQGEDIFFDELEEPYHGRVLQAMHERAQDIDAFIAPCRYYVDLMSRECGFPAEKIHVVPLGIEAEDFRLARDLADDAPVTIGYLARICPEKGFGQVVEAFRLLSEEVGKERVLLKAAGYLKELDRPFFDEQVRRLESWGLAERFEHQGEVDRQGKIDFLADLDIFTMPTISREPLASGVPVVLPRHGGFPELVEATSGGVLVDPEDPAALARGLAELVRDPERRRQLGRDGRGAVLGGRGADQMARSVIEVYEKVLRPEVAAEAEAA